MSEQAVEIKHRLWRKDADGWVLTGYAKWNNSSGVGLWFYSKHSNGIFRRHYAWDYIHTHRDRFVGVKDSEGVDVYEGDILEVRNAHGEVSKVTVGEFGKVEMRIDWDGSYDTLLSWVRLSSDIDFYHIEVIGNVKQNPELKGVE